MTRSTRPAARRYCRRCGKPPARGEGLSRTGLCEACGIVGRVEHALGQGAVGCAEWLTCPDHDPDEVRRQIAGQMVLFVP